MCTKLVAFVLVVGLSALGCGEGNPLSGPSGVPVSLTISLLEATPASGGPPLPYSSHLHVAAVVNGPGLDPRGEYYIWKCQSDSAEPDVTKRRDCWPQDFKGSQLGSKIDLPVGNPWSIASPGQIGRPSVVTYYGVWVFLTPADASLMPTALRGPLVDSTLARAFMPWQTTYSD